MEEIITTTEAPEAAPVKETVGFWTYFGLAALFAIPVVGFIACLVFMFAPKCKSLKNYARATMAWMVTGLLITVLVVSALISIVGNLLLPMINDALEDTVGIRFESVGEIVSSYTMLQKGDYTGVIALHKDKLIQLAGEENAPLIEELATGDYNDLFNQLQESEYDALLQDVKDGRYEELMEMAGDGAQEELIAELEKAADGEYSEMLEELKQVIPSF